jgi:aryl-alcohol dehydrogenase-like predicted oxidoreductase
VSLPLALGTATLPEAPFELLDAWLEAGGDVIDTARRYDDAEEVIGRWLRERDCRERITLATKGCHYNLTTGESRVRPEVIAADLSTSLERIGVDSVDLYWLHRDDPAVPVGPLVDALNRELAAGRIHAFGASNWTPARLSEAAAYAERNGLESFSCSSVELGLAVPAVEPWPGCVSVHDPASTAWYEARQLPVVAWSAQSAGFFAGVASDHVRRVYTTVENTERRARATQLGRDNGCTATQIALSWVLRRPYPVTAVIGPRTIRQLRESVEAVEIELTPDECAWLDLTA